MTAVDGVVRILTANLWRGRAHPQRFAELVAAVGADVVAVQELVPEQAHALERVLPHGRLEPAHDHEGMGLALRHPAPVQQLPLTARPAWMARLDGGAWPSLVGPLEVVNVHVLAPHRWPPWRTLAQRRGQIRELAGYLEAAADIPRAVVGDLNATPLWPAYRRLAACLQDAAVVAARRATTRPRGTWGPGARSPRLLRIDHVLVENLRVERVEVVRVPGSDHCAVLADVAPLRDAASPAVRDARAAQSLAE